LLKYYAENSAFILPLRKEAMLSLEKKSSGKEITTIIPLHRELAFGTLKGILDLAQIEEKDFWKNV